MYKMFQYSFIGSYTDMIHVYAAFEESLIETIRDGNFLEISKKITPKAFTKCEKNALLISMLVSPSYSINSLKVQNWEPAYDFTEIKISFELLLHDFLRTRCKLPVVYSTATQTLSCNSLKWITLTTLNKKRPVDKPKHDHGCKHFSRIFKDEELGNKNYMFGLRVLESQDSLNDYKQPINYEAKTIQL